MNNENPVNVRFPLISVVLFPDSTMESMQRCLDSILQQKTKFPYEIVIIDRGCTPEVADLCQEYCATYPAKIRFFSRRGIHDSVLNDKYRIYTNGEYVVVCTGAEEWFDESKLDRQAEFLTGHLGYSVCFHNVAYMVNGKEQIIRLKKERDYCLPEIGMKKLMGFYSPMFRMLSAPQSFHLALCERMGGEVFMGRVKQGKMYALASILSRIHNMNSMVVKSDETSLSKPLVNEINIAVR